MHRLTFLLALAACSRPSPRAEVEAGPAVVDAGSSLPPLAAEWLEKVELPKGGVAYVAPPLGSTEPRPVIVAVHGAIDHPGAMCAAWRAISDGYAFVVCPAGARAGKDAFVWSSSDMIAQAIDAALAAVRTKYGERVQSGPALYAAFSQGATMAGPLLATGRFPRAALTEGGYRSFEGGLGRAFVKAGGQRVLYTCSQGACTSSFAGSASELTAAGALVRVESPGRYGHTMSPQVRTSINASLGWLVEGLAGWEGYAAAPKLEAH